jgi:hypothetical protein
MQTTMDPPNHFICMESPEYELILCITRTVSEYIEIWLVVSSFYNNCPALQLLANYPSLHKKEFPIKIHID